MPNVANPIAIKKLEAVVTKVKTLDPSCAVCAGGEAPNGAATAIGVRGVGLNQRRGHPKQLLQRCQPSAGRTRRGRWQRTAIRPSPVHRAGRR